MTSPDPRDPSTWNWADIGQTFLRLQADTPYPAGQTGAQHTGDVLRRLFERIGHAWITKAEHERLCDMAAGNSRAAAEQARAALDWHEAEYARKLAGVKREIAAALRDRCDERTVPARLRREGVLLAADWIDPPRPPDSSPAGELPDQPQPP